MDVKKSKKATLEDKKMLNILMGLVMVLSLIYIAFEWTEHEVKVYDVSTPDILVEEEIEIIQTAQELPPPPPPPAPEVVEIINVVEDDVEVEQIEIETEDNDQEIDINPNTTDFGTSIGEEVSDVPFVIVEKMPSFPGGEEALFKYLGENVQYPRVAQENGIQGLVVCQFVVNRDGSIVDVVVVRGADPSLDKEAVRVITAMPKWRPGQQRGKPVRVKYTLPVKFRLQ